MGSDLYEHGRGIADVSLCSAGPLRTMWQVTPPFEDFARVSGAAGSR